MPWSWRAQTRTASRSRSRSIRRSASSAWRIRRAPGAGRGLVVDRRAIEGGGEEVVVGGCLAARRRAHLPAQRARSVRIRGERAAAPARRGRDHGGGQHPARLRARRRARAARVRGASAVRRRAALPQVQQQSDRRGADQVALGLRGRGARQLEGRRRGGAPRARSARPADRGPRPGRRIRTLLRRPRDAAPARRRGPRGVALVPLRRRVRREPADRRHRRHAREARRAWRGPSCARRRDCSRA